MLTSCLCGKPLEPGQMRCAECQAAYDDVEPVQAISEAEWRELEQFIAEREIVDFETYLDAYTPSQQTPNIGKISQQQKTGGKHRRNTRGRK